MLQAVAEKLDMVFPRRKGIGLSSELVPKLTHQDELLLW